LLSKSSPYGDNSAARIAAKRWICKGRAESSAALVTARELHRKSPEHPMRHESKVVELWPKQGTHGGLHLLVEWFGCAGSTTLLEDSALLRRLCLIAAEAAGLPILAELFQRRDPSGVIGVLLLPDSHLTIHTWPLEGTVTLDVFVGLHARNNRAKARAVYGRLRDGFKPDKENLLQVRRGGGAVVALAPRLPD
jgi:S-adenosylmethionine/arginine decarboxylase-like enzyme